MEYAKNHNSMKNKNYWQNICKCSNCISYKSQTASIDKSEVFDFDTIQIMENEELQQLSEAVNKEIVKNSQDIVFEEEEKISQENLIKLNDVKSKLLSYNQEIFFEGREENVLMRGAMEKDEIKENKKNNKEIFEKEKEDISMQTTLIRSNKSKNKVLKENQTFFKEKEENFSERYMIKLKEEKADILKNSQEIMFEESKDDFLKRNMIWLNKKNAYNLKNCQETTFKKEEGTLERKLVKSNEGNGDILNHISEEEQFAFIKVRVNPNNIKHSIRDILYTPKKEYKTKNDEFSKQDYEVCFEKKQKLHNKKCYVTLINRDQKNTGKNTEKNIFMKKKRSSPKKFDKSLSDYVLTINDKRSFKESVRNKNNKLIVSINQDIENPKSDPFSNEEHNSSKKCHRNFTDYFVMTDNRKSEENAISNMKNVRILKKGQKFLQQILNDPVMSSDHLNSNSIFCQQLNYDFLR